MGQYFEWGVQLSYNLKIKKGLVLKAIGDELLVFDPSVSQAFRLQSSAAEVMIQLAEGSALELDRTEVMSAIEFLVEKGLLEEDLIAKEHRRRFLKRAGAVALAPLLSSVYIHPANAATGGAGGNGCCTSTITGVCPQVCSALTTCCSCSVSPATCDCSGYTKVCGQRTVSPLQAAYGMDITNPDPLNPPVMVFLGYGIPGGSAHDTALGSTVTYGCYDKNLVENVFCLISRATALAQIPGYSSTGEMSEDGVLITHPASSTIVEGMNFPSEVVFYCCGSSAS